MSRTSGQRYCWHPTSGFRVAQSGLGLALTHFEHCTASAVLCTAHGDQHTSLAFALAGREAARSGMAYISISPSSNLMLSGQCGSSCSQDPCCAAQAGAVRHTCITHASYMHPTCIPCITHASHMHHTSVTHASHMHHTCIIPHASQLPHACYTHASHMHPTCFTHASHIPHTCIITHATHLHSPTCITNATHMLHTCLITHASHMEITCIRYWLMDPWSLMLISCVCKLCLDEAAGETVLAQPSAA